MPAIDHIGLTGPSFDADIERGKIREFARAMAAPLPEFTTGNNPVIPATFLVSVPYTWGYTLERPRGTVFEKVDHDLAVSIHAEEAFEFYGAMLRAGDRLVVHSAIEDVREKIGRTGGAMTFLVVRTEYHDRDGALRASQHSTSVTTERPDENDGMQPPSYVPDYPGREPASPFASIQRARWQDLNEGSSPGPVATGPLAMRDIVAFQGVVGEDDPLHYDDKWAKARGYPGPFALGMQQASWMAAYAAHWLAPETVRSFKVRFRDMCWPGDKLVYQGTVTGTDPATRQVELHLTCRRENGDLINEAWMKYDFNFESGD